MEAEPLSLLIVDDDPAVLEVLRSMTAMGFPELTIHCADNGHNGLDCFLRHAPDIVVTDLNMPVLNGITMAARMKATHPEVTIIALTAHTDCKYLLQAIEIGIDQYLLKPLDYEKLAAAIEKHAARKLNIAHRRQLEIELLRSQNELQMANILLEKRVDDRTHDLKASMQELESFCYSVSHDLRAPLRHINSFCAILMEEHAQDIPNGAQHYLEKIRDASGRMGHLIDHLLKLSRVGRTALKIGPVNLSELAASILSALQETDVERCVEVVIEPGHTVLGDATLLQQMLENLLGNAWKYSSRKPSARIEFRATVVAGQPVFFVRDDGAGFDMAYKDNLFRTFQRLHGSEFEGYGIGLATVQRIVRRHGGDIWAEGEVDRGASFYFTMPVHF